MYSSAQSMCPPSTVGSVAGMNSPLRNLVDRFQPPRQTMGHLVFVVQPSHFRTFRTVVFLSQKVLSTEVWVRNNESPGRFPWIYLRVYQLRYKAHT